MLSTRAELGRSPRAFMCSQLDTSMNINERRTKKIDEYFRKKVRHIIVPSNPASCLSKLTFLTLSFLHTEHDLELPDGFRLF